MVTEALGILYAGLGLFDGWLTRKRILTYGPDVELNAAICNLSKKLGPEIPVLFLIILPTTIYSGLGLYFHLTWVLALLVGFRLRMFYFQLLSILLERRLRRLKKELAKSSAGGQGDTPSSPLDSKESPSQPPASSSKDNE